MQKILLLNPPFHTSIIRDNYCCFTTKGDYLWPPIDLLAISGHLSDKSKFKTKVIDAVADNLASRTVIQQTQGFNPDYIIALTGTASYKSDKVFFEKLTQKVEW